MWVFVVLLLFWLFVARNYRHNATFYLSNNSLEKNAIVKFTFFTFFTQRNILRAYIYLGLELMRKDRGELRDQQNLLLNLLFKKFLSFDRRKITKIYLNIMRHYNFIDLESVYKWIDKHSKSNEKESLIHLLCGLAYHNDQVNTGEFKFIYTSAEKIGLSLEQVRSIIALHQERLENKLKNSRQSKESSTNTKLRQKIHILGLSGQPSLNQIKKAYRDLAKKYHPDLFHNVSDYEKQQAHERFLTVNGAYEYLMKHLN
jgi:hypothetical protein